MILDKILEHDLTKVAITGGAAVDPDGLACVEAMALIIREHNPDAHIDKFYNGKFDRPQNKTMRELLRLNQRQVRSDDGEYTCVISVDGPATTSAIQPVDFVIDHHPADVEPRVAMDVRAVGACSSIMWEYLVAAGIDIKEFPEVATALAIGISTDTAERISETTSPLDLEAEAACCLAADHKLYVGIKQYPKPHYYADFYVLGWQNKEIEGTCLVTNLGIIAPERSGVISHLAEEFSAFIGVETCCVIAMVGDFFHASVRTSDTNLNANDFCKQMGVGGGRRGAGVFRVELPDAFKGTNDPAMFDAGYNILMDKILKFTGDGARTTAKFKIVEEG